VEFEVIAIARPEAGEYNPAFQRYVDRVQETDVLDAFARQVDEVSALLTATPPTQETYRHAEGKWSVRMVVGHIVDTERIFGYRLLALARGEKQSLPGYEENDYAAVAAHDAVELKTLLEEFALVRRSHVLMIKDFDDAAWGREGITNGKRMTVRAMPYIMVGHVRHHLAVLTDKYGLTG
jgi:hypothetical protein